MLVNLIYREVLVKNSLCQEDNVESNCRKVSQKRSRFVGLSLFKWKESRETFESLRTYCHEQLSSIPLTFVLGFYVSLIVTRWWRQYSLLPWPDSMAMYTAAFLTGKMVDAGLMREDELKVHIVTAQLNLNWSWSLT